MTTSVVTIFGLDQIAAGVRDYFAAPDRLVSAEVVVDEWDLVKHHGRPIVVIGLGDFRIVGAAALPPGFRWAPNSRFDLGDGRFAPVIGARIQQFPVWAHSLGGEFATPDPAVLQVAARNAACALLDVTYAALRDIHGHDLPPMTGKPWMPEGDVGDFIKGSVLQWTLEIPIPLLGDVIAYITPDAMTGTTSVVVNGSPSVPGDPLEAP